MAGSVSARERSTVRVAALAAASLALGFKFGARPVFGPLSLAASLAWALLAFLTWRSLRPPAASRERAPVRLRVRVLALLLSLGLAEAVLALATHGAAPRLRRAGVMLRGDDESRLGAERFARFLQRDFDPELGWDQPRRFEPFGRARPAPGSYPDARIAAYGDSFTHCTGPDQETWEAHLAARLGTQVVNYGVPGYGPDQALLKFRRETKRHTPRLVFIGYLAENVARLVNVYRCAYQVWEQGTLFDRQGEVLWAPTKPRFELHAGALRLRPNPVRNAAGLERLLRDRRFRAELQAHDYFAAGYEPERLAPVLGFPYLLRAPAAAARLLRPRTGGDAAAALLRDPQARALLFAVIDAFCDEVRRAGAQPVVLLFGHPRDLDHYLRHGRHLRLGPLVEHLQARGREHVDTVALLARHHATLQPGAQAGDYFDSGGHHSSYAHRVLAESLAGWLRERQAERLAH